MQWATFELLGVPNFYIEEVGVHVQERHSGGRCDRKRGGALTKEARSAALIALEKT